ncbi:toxin-antitoxin system YwqK family antitoxin [Streptomyces sp. NPDC017993]|uniref:toxin-antitoxin system YwqK family antitoxin n=1 Tax=Streptomyces sp. NPDC017993 TaxID=3365027 RepID=UPI0037BDD025
MRINDEDTSLESGNVVYFQDKPFTGEVVTHDEEGRVISLVTYLEGFESGTQTEWYPNGSQKEEGNCRLGVAVGEWRTWYPNGQLSECSVFSPKGKYLRRRQWDEIGNLTVDKTYTA